MNIESERALHLSKQDTVTGKGWRLYLQFLSLAFFTVMAVSVGLYLFQIFTGIALTHEEGQAQLAPGGPIVAVPTSVCLALFVVLFLRFSIGPMEFEGLGFKFKGGSGPLLLWVVCFLSLVLGFSVIKL